MFLFSCIKPSYKLQLEVLTLSRQFIATIGTFEATRIFFELSYCEWYLFIASEVCFQNIIVKIVCLEWNIMYSGVNFPV
jgi:hypothetical protein